MPEPSLLEQKVPITRDYAMARIARALALAGYQTEESDAKDTALLAQGICLACRGRGMVP